MTRPLSSPPPLPPAGALYGPDKTRMADLSHFAAALKLRGWKVGGLVQENLFRPDGQKLGIDAIALDTGQRIPIVRYTDMHLSQRVCGLDENLLAEATHVLRRAVDQRADVLIVEKFADREKEGAGLSDEILLAMSEEIPTLVAVSADALDRWNGIIGDMGVLVPLDETAFWHWWGPHRIYRDLELGVADVPARRVVVGVHFTLVEGPTGCGLAQTPERLGKPRDQQSETGYRGRSLRDLASLVHSWDPFEAAVGLAAVNAHYNRIDLTGPDTDGLRLVADADGPVASVGRFAGLDKRRLDWTILERDPAHDEHPVAAASWLLPRHEWAAVTASALVDHSLPDIVAARGRCAISLVGPSTPLTNRLHAYGIRALSGFIVSDSNACARIVAEGGNARALRAFGRRVTLTAPENPL